MLFNSLGFLIFFTLTGVLYFAVPARFRWGLLLFCSYVFYMSWEAAHAVYLAVLTIFNYYLAIQLGKSDAPGRKKAILTLSIISNAGLLFAFKYLSFFCESLRAMLGFYGLAVSIPAVSVALPMGISFFTFKIMNYAVDVYRGKKTPEKKLGLFALYVAFFPQLIAGPIDRSTSLLPQFHEPRPFDYKRVTDGLKLMLWGFFQKMVIADTLAGMVDPVFAKPGEHGPLTLALAAIFFTFQIYCDFSGYSDIAIGIAQVFGFKSMNNFERPYFSRSIPEFWRRWHISLSTWFRDYLYIPLGGNRISVPRWYFNLLVVFLVSGLWHGANWTFVVWGAIHGFFYIFSVLTGSVREKLWAAVGLDRLPRLHAAMQVFTTFCLVAFAWIFFKAATISDAFLFVSRLFTGWGSLSGEASKLTSFVFAHFFEFSVAVVAITIMELVHVRQAKGSIREMLGSRPLWQRWAVYYSLIAAVLLFGNFGLKQFIYFQF